jgi:glycyl-tRNA synthetase beta chain
MSDFLLELRCEEIPARMQAGARADLEKLFLAAMRDAGVTPGAITVWSTPRRLALIAHDLPQATEPVCEEVKGPRSNAPAQALEGFLRKTGLTREQLTERDGVFFAITEKPGRAMKDVLAEAIPGIVRAFPWPKSQRWGAASISTESLRWVRPLSSIVAIFGENLVECEVGGISSGFATKGHRFHHPGDITIGSAGDYQQKLRACHVIVDHAEREALIREQARAVAEKAGLELVEDEGLVVENAGLTEWPVPLLGRFDPEFLEVPPEVIQLTARINQKYFICRDKAGQLANAFICTANIVALDGGHAIVDGNRKVLAARLSDARFFWEQDRKKTLAEHAEGLARITFHEKLGTVADKVERVAKLAEWLASEGIVPGCDPALARRAAELCKADLVTEMVGEFPELQGLMGGYYARAEGLPDEVADAIRDHYKPVGQGDDVPTAPVTVAVSLADKLDTLVGIFVGVDRPTGSKDPFALRRAAQAICAIIISNNLRTDLPILLDHALDNWLLIFVFSAASNDNSLREKLLESYIISEDDDDIDYRRLIEDFTSKEQPRQLITKLRMNEISHSYLFNARDMAVAWILNRATLLTFFADRLKVQQREAGVRHDLIDAVFALGGEDDLVRLLARVHALQAFIGSTDGTNLLAGYKRASNILKKEQFEPKPHSYTPEPAEKALIDALDAAAPRAAQAVEAEDFAGAMAALASLRAPIDAFFEEVTVNDDDKDKRASRLALLARFRDAVHRVADFSRIEG